MSHKAHHPAHPCHNCGHFLAEGWTYCPECGQKNEDLELPIGHVLEEVAEGIWHFDSKIWATIKALVLRPGKITKDFLDGHRVRYVPPIRLYVFVSFVFFLLFNSATHHRPKKELDYYAIKPSKKQKSLSYQFDSDTSNDRPLTADEKRLRAIIRREKSRIWLGKRQGIVFSQADAAQLQPLSEQAQKQRFADSLSKHLSYPFALDANPAKARCWQDSLAVFMVDKDDTLLMRPLEGGRVLVLNLLEFENVPMDTANTQALVYEGAAARNEVLDRYHVTEWQERLAVPRLAKLFENGEAPSTVQEVFVPLLIKVVSYGMFLFMPLTALVLFGLFRKQRGYYTEHLIHALHLHAAFFLIVILLHLLPAAFGSGSWLSGIRALLFVLIALAYPLLSVKRVYGQSWGITIGKYAALAVSYGVLFAVFLLIVVFSVVLIF